MEKKVKSKEELLKDKDQILEIYNSNHRKSNKPALLTKKGKKSFRNRKGSGKSILKYARISPEKLK